MTKVEADAALETAKQAGLISVHADRSVLSNNASFKNKKFRGKGDGKGKGGKGVPLRLLLHRHH